MAELGIVDGRRQHAYWATGVYEWQWRIMLPLSVALELAGFLIFFLTVRQHKSQHAADGSAKPRPLEVWMRLVIASTIAFLAIAAAESWSSVLRFAARGEACHAAGDR